MKFKRLLFLLFFVTLPTFAYQQQGFSSYQENGSTVDFVCTSQCVLVLDEWAGTDALHIAGQIQGQGTIGYGFLVGQQIAPGWSIEVRDGILDTDFSVSDSPMFAQLPSTYSIVLLVQGNIQASQVSFKASSYSLFQNIAQWFSQALAYKEYNPRTINFLEWPLWNGVYINKYFLPWIVVLLIVAWLVYLLNTRPESKKKAFFFGVGVLVFFWIFFDFLSTVNQSKIYQQTMSATNSMDNARVGRSSDFYQFLDFVKTKVPFWSYWTFVASYPFEFEGKYHMYPDVKFSAVTWAKYIFFYNPYGSQAPFDFKDPVYTWGVLNWNGMLLSVQEEIVRRPYAKIYLLKK